MLIKHNHKISWEKLKSIVIYNPDTGIFHWVNRRYNKQAGGRSKGYVTIEIGETRYLAHRLAWFYITGGWPENLIDHKNGIRSDNRWCNLREATHGQNKQNAKVMSHSKSGIKGITKARKGYQARITIGTFPTAEEAGEAYKKIAILIQKEFMFTNAFNS